MRYYHVTSQPYIESIQTSGLTIPQRNETDAERCAVYMFDDWRDGYEWTRTYFGLHTANHEHDLRHIKFLVLDLPDSWALTRDDEDAWRYGEAWFSLSPVPKKYISHIMARKEIKNFIKSEE